MCEECKDEAMNRLRIITHRGYNNIDIQPHIIVTTTTCTRQSGRHPNSYQGDIIDDAKSLDIQALAIGPHQPDGSARASQGDRNLSPVASPRQHTGARSPKIKFHVGYVGGGNGSGRDGTGRRLGNE